MPKNKEKTDYSRFTSPATKKLFMWVFSAMVAISGILLLIITSDTISEWICGQGRGIFSSFEWFYTFSDILFAILLVLIIAFGTIIIYTYTTNRYKEVENRQEIIVESPLLGLAKEHEAEIIERLKTLAKPTKGKPNLRRAGTVHFLRALTILGYMDANTSGPNMMAWVEMVTGYKDKDVDSGHFFSAYNKTYEQDPKVRDYIRQIKQIVGK